MIKILILEDDHERHVQFKNNFVNCEITIVETVKEAIKELVENQFDYLFLDHDLGGQVNVNSIEENTGGAVARFLRDHPDRMPNLVILHSLNMAGCKYMKNILPDSVMMPFAWNKMTIDNFEYMTVFKRIAESQNQQIEYGKL